MSNNQDNDDDDRWGRSPECDVYFWIKSMCKYVY